MDERGTRRFWRWLITDNDRLTVPPIAFVIALLGACVLIPAVMLALSASGASPSDYEHPPPPIGSHQ